jgi:hypothetical protein
VEGRKYLSTGLTPLNDAERQNISRLQNDIERELTPLDGDDRLKTSMLAQMMISLAGGNTDELEARSKQAVYAAALEEIPAWAVREALRQWYRGQVKTLKIKADEYRWPPAPGVLAIICRGILQPYHDAIEKLNDVLTAKPLDETMKELHQRGAA